MTIIYSLFFTIGFMASVFGLVYLVSAYIEHRTEMMRLLRECRDLLKQQKRN
jgi:hypothetical protein